jgi:hypothetical protein
LASKLKFGILRVMAPVKGRDGHGARKRGTATNPAALSGARVNDASAQKVFSGGREKLMIYPACKFSSAAGAYFFGAPANSALSLSRRSSSS